MMDFKKFTAIAAISLFSAANVSAAIKVACVGNSITEGYGIWDKKKYPEHLQDMLGSEYEVSNFGHSGRMFHQASAESYWVSDKFKAAYEYAPDIVVIELGTNDSKYFFDGKGSSSGYNYMYKPENKADLAKDYEALIDTFAHQPQAPTIYATLQPYAQNVEWGIVDTAIVNVINPIIKDVATRKGVKIIDLHSTFNKTEWLLDDVVHPNEEGAKELAKIIADGIKGALPNEIPNQIAGQLRTNYQFSTQGMTISINGFSGKVNVFDLNGILVKQVHSNGFVNFKMEHPGVYIVKTGSMNKRVELK